VAEKKGSKGKSESPWSLHIRSFWKIHSINPPEVKAGFFKCSFMGRTTMIGRYQKVLPWSIAKMIYEKPLQGSININYYLKSSTFAKIYLPRTTGRTG